jgi:hypothetical protein
MKFFVLVPGWYISLEKKLYCTGTDGFIYLFFLEIYVEIWWAILSVPTYLYLVTAVSAQLTVIISEKLHKLVL